MNSNNNGEEKLPDGWKQFKSKSNPGRNYYFHMKTGKSLWTQPKAEDGPSKCEQNKRKNKREKNKKKDEPQKKNLKRKCCAAEDQTSTKKLKPEKTAGIRKPQPKKPPSKRDDRAKKFHAITLKKESPRKPTIPVPSPRSVPSPLPTQRTPNTLKNVARNQLQHPSPKLTPLVPSKETAPKNINDRLLRPSPKSTPSTQSKETTPKNLASNRLSHLRAQLDFEIQQSRPEDIDLSPAKVARCSPKAIPSESPLNESKVSTTQSPSSDSIQSAPSPSQFFAANKIISSMKAQLPEEYCNKTKQKDTFADIEQGICNQTAEYPSLKHPATPPQFSEASKLVSAIKSKLSYKVPYKDTPVKTFMSAKDRMEALRNRLSNDAERDDSLSSIELPKFEAMDVEDSEEMRQTTTSFQCTNVNSTEIKENVVLVVDTNIFIHELDVIKNVLNSHIKGYSEQPTLLVPWRVINELDRLKDNNNGNGAICKRARSAMDYLYKSLPENSRIKGQSLRDANCHIYPCELPDDEILNCCLQQKERGISVILLSNDKNLCNKASINGVKCITLADLKPLLENKPQATVDPDLYASVKHYENTMHQLLANILENEMRAKYNNLWQHVLFKAPPWTLSDVLQCLLKHWIAVFNEVFPRIEHLITDLRHAWVSIESKRPNSLSQSEVTNFKELCLDIAKKCQIIPEYMQLAKITVERLLNKDMVQEEQSEMPIIDAFEGLWIVFSSYCAKLASALGISHTLEDKLPGNDPLHVLMSKWSVFCCQIRALTSAMKGLLENTDSIEEEIPKLAEVFKESLSVINKGSISVNKDNMRIFCLNCRNMLQEAFTKFSALSELLNICQTRLSN
ncbi:transcriptional protein SWT1 isoform X2 [Hyposmocoma kahamanoa]|uniref:transcriptional protein SWT1 isoform X2 n=1 Tax=Hyposmocoma kahamanoa TaxID=1477025 RepID=UPI000E6D700C|nr:transcriptional protein SWT1 isoform X2 [Hyposmocoma kahamanoa]